jgi:hypothetical protein
MFTYTKSQSVLNRILDSPLKSVLVSRIIWEIPFWFGLLFFSLVPSRIKPVMLIGNLPVEINDIILILIAIYYYFKSSPFRADTVGRIGLHHRVFFFFLLLLIYALISMYWSNLESPDFIPMAYTIVCSFFSVLLGYMVVVKCPKTELPGFLNRIVIFITVISAIYCLESYLILGLRSFEGIELVEFGIDRVHGPLYGSSTGQFILLPAFALALGNVIDSKRNLTVWVCISSVLIITLFSLGSRASVVCLCLFFLLSGLLVRKILFVILSICIICSSLLLVMQSAQVDRLFLLEDQARYINHMTSYEIVRSSMPFFLLGHGYGSYWPWYLPDVQDGGARVTGRYVSETQFGYLLYHPHSVVLMLIVELGVVGLLFLIYLMYVQFKIVFHAKLTPKMLLFAAGIVSSSAAFLLDFYLFKNWSISLLWWIFLFSTIASIMQDHATKTFHTKIQCNRS